MTFYEAAQVAKEAGVKEMWLTHYSPSLTRPEEYMDEVRAIFPKRSRQRIAEARNLYFLINIDSEAMMKGFDYE